YNLSLDEAVGVGGMKFHTKNLSREERILGMKSAMIEMIQNGTSTVFDFREDGIKGINEIKEAASNLPIDIHILGRPNHENLLSEIISQSNGLGLPTPLVFSLKEMDEISSEVFDFNTIIGTHIAETQDVVNKSLNRFGSTDLQVALKHLNPTFLIHLTALKEPDYQEIPSSIFVVFCPRSNAYFGLGFPKIEYFLKNKYAIGLGTDNVMVISPNVLEELRWIILRLKEQNFDIDPIHALKLITSYPSKAFSLETGCIKQGYWADLLVIDLNSIRTRFGLNPIMSLLFRANLPSDISLNLYHGKVVTNDYR
ncbi:MAG: amidohydrolase family protein, partial [Candidatus Hodarchaeales archaeon]